MNEQLLAAHELLSNTFGLGVISPPGTNMPQAYDLDDVAIVVGESPSGDVLFDLAVCNTAIGEYHLGKLCINLDRANPSLYEALLEMFTCGLYPINQKMRKKALRIFEHGLAVFAAEGAEEKQFVEDLVPLRAMLPVGVVRRDGASLQYDEEWFDIDYYPSTDRWSATIPGLADRSGISVFGTSLSSLIQSIMRVTQERIDELMKRQSVLSCVRTSLT